MIDEVELLFSIAEEKTGLTKEVITSGNRKPNIIDVKRIMGAILRKNTKMRLWQIGEALGGLDHSCISHYLKTNQDLMDTDYSFRKKLVLMESTFITNRNSVEIKLNIKLIERRKINKEINRLRKLINIKESYKNELDLANTVC